MFNLVRLVLSSLTVASMFWAGAGRVSASLLDVIGSTYTSPSYGYTITWTDDWSFIDESTEDGYDILNLTDGLSLALFNGGPAYGSPQMELAATGATCGSNGTFNCQAVLDEQGESIKGSDETSAFQVISFSQDATLGPPGDYVSYLGVRTISPGISLLINATVSAGNFESGYLEKWASLFSGIDLRGDPAASVPVTCDRSDPSCSVTAESSGVQPAGAIVSDTWRFSIATATRSPELPALNLAAKPDREWVVIVADVFNWSDLDGEFQLRSPILQTAEMTEPYDLAPASTKSVAALLGLTGQQNEVAAIAPGQTARIVLVYSIPFGGIDLDLAIGLERMSLEDLMDPAFDPALLPEMSSSPVSQEALLTNVSFESTVNPDGTVTGNYVVVSVEGSSDSYYLAGIDSPGLDSCHFETSWAGLFSIVTSYPNWNAILELDNSSGVDELWYVWLSKPDGSKTLLNELLVENGMVSPDTSNSGSLFAGWLEESGDAAEQAALGVWNPCGESI